MTSDRRRLSPRPQEPSPVWRVFEFVVHRRRGQCRSPLIGKARCSLRRLATVGVAIPAMRMPLAFNRLCEHVTVRTEVRKCRAGGENGEECPEFHVSVPALGTKATISFAARKATLLKAVLFRDFRRDLKRGGLNPKVVLPALIAVIYLPRTLVQDEALPSCVAVGL